MAYVKIFAIRKQLKKTVEYVTNKDKTTAPLDEMLEYALNPEKTMAEQKLYESTINLMDVRDAFREMSRTKEYFGKTEGVLGYHIIQSFKPGEITADKCHELGRRLAEELFGDRFQIVVGTHLNKEHLHNHIIINSVSFVDGKKLRFNKKSYYEMQKISDGLCLQEGLFVIETRNKGKNYKEWQAEKEGKPTVRSQVRSDIDRIIKESYNYNTFLDNLERKGYAIKESPTRTYTAIKPPFGERYIRLNSLGENYTKEKIIERLYAQDSWQKKVKLERRRYYPQKLPKKRKRVTGIQALYLRYVYMLKLNKPPKGRISRYLWDDIRKFEDYKKDFTYLRENNITSKGELLEKISELKAEMEKLKEQRKPMYEQKRRKKDESKQEEIKQRIAELNSDLKEMRKDCTRCERIIANLNRLHLEQEEEKESYLHMKTQAAKHL